MRKPFTLRVEEKLIDNIKMSSIKKGYKNYADYIEDLLIKGLVLEILESTNRVLSDDNLKLIEELSDNVRKFNFVNQ